MTDQELIARAREMQKYAYVPYSRFPVGAALECDDGTVYTGCNVENASYGACICAERTALVKAISDGRRKGFTRIAVVGNSAGFGQPCGICRQMLSEFAPDLEILAADARGRISRHSLRELLPESFGSDALENPPER